MSISRVHHMMVRPALVAVFLKTPMDYLTVLVFLSRYSVLHGQVDANVILDRYIGHTKNAVVNKM